MGEGRGYLTNRLVIFFVQYLVLRKCLFFGLGRGGGIGVSGKGKYIMRLTTIYLPFLVELGLGVALGLWMADAVNLEATPNR